MALHQVRNSIHATTILLVVCVCAPLVAQDSARAPIWERRPYQCEILLKVDSEDLLREGTLKRVSERIPRILSARYGQALDIQISKGPTTSPVVQKWMNDRTPLATLCDTEAQTLNLMLPTDRRAEKYFVAAILANRAVPLVCVWEWDRWVEDWSPLVARPFANDRLELAVVDAISAAFRPQAKIVRVAKTEVDIRIRASNLPYRLPGNQPLLQGMTAEIFLDGKPVPNSWMVVTERTNQISKASVRGELEFTRDSDSDVRTLQTAPTHYRSDVQLFYRSQEQPGSRLFVELLELDSNKRVWSGRSNAAGRINIPRTSVALARLVVSWDGITLHDSIMMPCLNAVENVILDIDESDMEALGELSDLTSLLTVLEAEQQVVAERTAAATKANDAGKVQEIKLAWETKKQKSLAGIQKSAGRFESNQLANTDNKVVKKNWKIFRERWQSLQTDAIKAESESKPKK